MVLAGGWRGGWPVAGQRGGWLVSSSKRCHFLAILRGMHDDENDDGHKGYDPWGHLAATAGLPAWPGVAAAWPGRWRGRQAGDKNLIYRDISFMLLLN